jgi:16S rRNA (cytosine1402-N4)-methyltransferase
MPEAVLSGLAVKPGGIYADGTLGGGGHALYIVQALTDGKLIGIDRDADALEAASERLRTYEGRFTALRGNFCDMPALLKERGIHALDGVLLDLGVSSHQLDTPVRGFSYRLDGPLDMRMDVRDTLTAYEIVNRFTEKQLTEIFFTYGEERYAKKIAKAIITNRPVETTLQLAALVENAVPAYQRAGHPAKRVFQALRIKVNDELGGLDAALRGIAGLLKPGGRLCVITFHSLEDRIVKQCFKSLASPCTCPRDFPYCVCGQKPVLRAVTRKPLIPDETETQANPRAHSAKLRIAERV